MDDIRPPRRPNTPSYGAQPNQNSNQYSPNPSQQYPQDSQPSQPEDYHLKGTNKKSGKRTKVFLVIFIILFIAAAALAAWLYFVQVASLQQEVDDLKKDNARLVEQVRSLDYDNRDLQRKLELAEQATPAPAGEENVAN